MLSGRYPSKTDDEDDWNAKPQMSPLFFLLFNLLPSSFSFHLYSERREGNSSSTGGGSCRAAASGGGQHSKGLKGRAKAAAKARELGQNAPSPSLYRHINLCPNSVQFETKSVQPPSETDSAGQTVGQGQFNRWPGPV